MGGSNNAALEMLHAKETAMSALKSTMFQKCKQNKYLQIDAAQKVLKLTCNFCIKWKANSCFLGQTVLNQWPLQNTFKLNFINMSNILKQLGRFSFS